MIPDRDAWCVRRLLTGNDLDGERECVSNAFRPLIDQLSGLRIEDRVPAWEKFLEGQADSEGLTLAVSRQSPDDPAPDGDEIEEEDAGGWEPISLPTLPPPEPFPADVLPGPVVALIDAGAESIGCPRDFLGLTVLVVASGVIGRSVRLLLKDSYFVGASIFAVNVAIASDGKTPAQMLVKLAISWIEERLRASFEEALRRRAEELAADPDAVARSRPRLAPPPEPKLPRLEIDDFTMEIVPALLAENPRGLVSIQDELTSLLRGLNQYKGGRGNDRSILLKIWSGDTIKKDRVGHPNHMPIIVLHPFLSILGGIPPDMLFEMTLAKGGSDGFLDRFLFAYPESNPVPLWSERGVPDHLKVEWSEIIGRIWDRKLAAKDGGLGPHTARFTPEGKRLWVEMFDRHASEMNAEDFPPDLRSPWGKLREYAGRLALVLACLRHASDPFEEPEALPEVREEDVRGAWRLVVYFKNHARRVRAVLAHGRDLWGGEAGKVIFDWIRAKKITTFEVHVNNPLTHRDAFNPNDPAATPDVVNLTYGINFEAYQSSVLTLGFVTPVTGPRPFDYEALVLLNIRFGRSRARAVSLPFLGG